MASTPIPSTPCWHLCVLCFRLPWMCSSSLGPFRWVLYILYVPFLPSLSQVAPTQSDLGGLSSLVLPEWPHQPCLACATNPSQSMTKLCCYNPGWPWVCLIKPSLTWICLFQISLTLGYLYNPCQIEHSSNVRWSLPIPSELVCPFYNWTELGISHLFKTALDKPW